MCICVCVRVILHNTVSAEFCCIALNHILLSCYNYITLLIVWSHFLGGRSELFIFTTKMVFPKSLESRNSGSEWYSLCRLARLAAGAV